MKIAITGHCNGLGLALYNKLTVYDRSKNNHVIGFDLENGYDISNKIDISKILWQIKDFDIFINNAYHNTGQTKLLEYILKTWKHKNKTVVHIGTYLVNHEIDPTWLPLHQEYVQIKKAQRILINQYRPTDSNLRIILINPGLMQTDFLTTMQVPATDSLINVLDCADAIVHSLKLLEHNIYIKELNLDNT